MKIKNKTLAANICLCKVDATRTMEFVARETSQILGGASYVIGKKIERIYRDVRALAAKKDNIRRIHQIINA